MTKVSGHLELNKGFTLIETIVAIFCFGLIAVGLIALFSTILIGSDQQSGLLSNIDQARKLTFSLTSQLRNAITSVTGSYSLEEANDQEIIFYSNIDKDAAPERLRYFLQNGKIYKGVVDPFGSPLVYNLSNEQINVVQDNVINGSAPLFYYYDGSYTGVSNNFLTQPVNVTAVKLVKISIKILNTGGVVNANSYTVTASAAIRNLKTNLGN